MNELGKALLRLGLMLAFIGAGLMLAGGFGLPLGRLAAARREFEEETGFPAPDNVISLGDLKQAGGKIVAAWAAEGDCDPAGLVSNTCEIEWPPRSGRKIEIPEVDRAAWFAIDEAR